MKIETNFLLGKEDLVFLPFDKYQNHSFNYVKFENQDDISNDEGVFYKRKSNSAAIALTIVNSYSVKELKLTNQNILTWDDLWIDEDTSYSVDPLIEEINLQRNSLLYVNFNLYREKLRVINLEGNSDLKSFIGTDLPSLEHLDFTNCFSLETIVLGLSKNIKTLSLKNCRLTEISLERVLSSFAPTKTASANIFPGSLPPFRKNYETLLDLRGNDINWGNRKIASKIRLLVTNNWLVLWDNPPPTSVIPIQMYAFFPQNLGDRQIKEYYTGMQMQQIPPAPPQAAEPSSQPQAADQAAQAAQANAA